MLAITFKDVGQGDSIILEWQKNEKRCVGIIDCSLYEGKNPVLQHIISNSICEIEFIILSHFHYDHFSGMGELFEYCISNKVRVNAFYHSTLPFVGEIYNRIKSSQKVQKSIQNFIEKSDMFDSHVLDKILIVRNLKEINLTENISLQFLAPKGILYDIMAKQLSRRVNLITTTKEDINKLSTIISISDKTNCILLTSDSVKKSFHDLQNIVLKDVQLVQVPHHGSWNSVNPKFWNNLTKQKNCTAILSVGDEPKDRLPNKETVAFFDLLKYDIYSTNKVYGINEHFFPETVVQEVLASPLNIHGKVRKRETAKVVNKYNGDQKFNFFTDNV